MLQDRATASPVPACGIPPAILNRCATERDVEPPLAMGARRGFEGLIANRGRQDGGNAARSSAAQTRTLAALRMAGTSTLEVGVAESRAQIEATDTLIRKRYAWRGYNLESFEYQRPSERPTVSRNSITFFAADQHVTLGTITLRLDGPDGLRAEATHAEALRSARTGGRRIGELTRLAVAEDVDSRSVLASLFGLVYAVGRWVHGVTDVFIEVNPRHVAFYARALGFTVVGEARFCERVGAPSVLLHLDVSALEDRLGLTNAGAAEEPMMRYGT